MTHRLEMMAGKSIVQAIENKFNDDESHDFTHIYVSKRGHGQNGMHVPKILALDNCDIICAGQSDKLDELCKDVREIDLTQNKLTDWKEIFSLLQHIPDLHFLNLTSNSLLNHTLNERLLQETFPHLQTLILNNTDTSLATVSELLKVFPSLLELHLSLNGYREVDLVTNVPYQTLVKLHLTGNRIQTFSELSKLGQCFPSLESLVNIDSGLNTMCPESQSHECFPALKCLNISQTHLNTWDDIDNFRKFPALTDVRLKGLPFLQRIEEKKRRQLLVARLPNISTLNGSPIHPCEREDAERAFIREYLNCDDKPPRYFELEAFYGKLDPLINLDFTPKNLLQMTVKFMDHSTKVMVDTNKTVKELKKSLENFCGVSSSKFRLVYLEKFGDEFQNSIEMSLLNKLVRTYSMVMSEEDELQIYLK